MHSFPQHLIDGYTAFIRGPYAEAEGKYKKLAREGQTPTTMLDAHLASGWFWETSEFEADARALTTISKSMHIRGGRDSGRYPFVEYQGAYYRSDKLIGARQRVGTRMLAEIDIEDLRHMVLLDDTGAPWSRLTALPPWSRTPHDLHLRQQINRARDRGLLSIAGVDDAVHAYADFTRDLALAGAAPPDAYARVQQQLLTQASPRDTSSHPPVRFDPQPRFGRTTFSTRKD